MTRRRKAIAESGLPLAFIHTRRLANGRWWIKVSQCPYCSGMHVHKGWMGLEPRLGRRLAPCNRAKRYELGFGSIEVPKQGKPRVPAMKGQ
jgi:hypothetical protein